MIGRKRSKTTALVLLSITVAGTVLVLAYMFRPSESSDRVLRLEGTHAEMGRQHGALAEKQIRLMVDEYIGDLLVDGKLKESAQEKVAAMKGSLPDWYLSELNACADEVGLERDVLLYAQCEGDIRSLPGCTTYVAYDKATRDGKMVMGRNFDYWGLETTEDCVCILTMFPKAKGHYAFVSVGWTGILGGWTFYNEKGLFVANNLGGFSKKNPKGIPTLILLRIVAETAATVDDAIRIIESFPRMRGQAIILGHAGDAEKGIKPSAVVVSYDAERIEVSQPDDGFVFHSSVGTDKASLLKAVKYEQSKPYGAIKGAGCDATLQSVAIVPETRMFWVAHGARSGAHNGTYVGYSIDRLLEKKGDRGKQVQR